MTENLADFYKPARPLEYDNSLITLLAPHVGALLRDANTKPMTLEQHAQQRRAWQVIQLYEMHSKVRRDPGARGLCKAAFEEWQRHRGTLPA